MASDLEPRIADDGVQEVPLTKARALLTRVIEQAREDDLVSAFTVRGRRRAYVVTPAFYARARDREQRAKLYDELAGLLRELHEDPEFAQRVGELNPLLSELLENDAL
ncbi:hypothetical protein ACWGLG_16095 [Streptomyces antimycoticus]